MNDSPLACHMSAIAPDPRVVSIRELPDGYAFQLPGDPDAIITAARFISLEKLCCPFLRFALEVEAEQGPAWLRVTGREGVKEFVREEINGILGGPINGNSLVVRP